LLHPPRVPSTQHRRPQSAAHPGTEAAALNRAVAAAVAHSSSRCTQRCMHEGRPTTKADCGP
ncbi:hypothetical protein BHE74_00048173, partial [Ensete ventricosum]